jgi:predicted kinase
VIDVFYSTIDHLLDRGVSLIADLSFRRGLDEAQLLARAARCQLVNIHCDVPTALAHDRFMVRQQHRPATGGAGSVMAKMQDGTFDWSIFEPLEIAIPRLIIDTRDGYAPDLAAISAFCGGQ